MAASKVNFYCRRCEQSYQVVAANFPKVADPKSVDAPSARTHPGLFRCPVCKRKGKTEILTDHRARYLGLSVGEVDERAPGPRGGTHVDSLVDGARAASPPVRGFLIRVDGKDQTVRVDGKDQRVGSAIECDICGGECPAGGHLWGPPAPDLRPTPSHFQVAVDQKKLEARVDELGAAFAATRKRVEDLERERGVAYSRQQTQETSIERAHAHIRDLEGKLEKNKEALADVTRMAIETEAAHARIESSVERLLALNEVQGRHIEAATQTIQAMRLAPETGKYSASPIGYSNAEERQHQPVQPEHVSSVEASDSVGPLDKSAMVATFMHHIGQAVYVVPEVPGPRVVKLRACLVLEEAIEFVEASIGAKASGHFRDLRDALQALKEISPEEIQTDIVEAADALADLTYVVEGAYLAYGVDGDEVFAAVHEANMKKLEGPVDPDTGKKLKPPGWTPPDILGVLRKQGYVPPPKAGEES